MTNLVNRKTCGIRDYFRDARKMVYHGQRNMSIPASMICKCRRCGHQWIKRIPGRPKSCSNCHETNWDVPAGKLKRGRPKKAA